MVERVKDLVHPELLPEVRKMSGQMAKFADIGAWSAGISIDHC